MSEAVGLVLAAGASRRMGAPKAGLRWRGRTFVDLAATALVDGGVARVIVVCGAVQAETMDRFLSVDADVVDHPEWAEGPTTTLQVGLRRALSHGACQAVVVHTLDRPRVRADTVRALLDAWGADSGCVWQPRHEGRAGHPVLWPAPTFADLLALGPTQTRRDVLTGPFAGRHRLVDVADPGVLDNVDDPNALDGLF